MFNLPVPLNANKMPSKSYSACPHVQTIHSAQNGFGPHRTTNAAMTSAASSSRSICPETLGEVEAERLYGPESGWADGYVVRGLISAGAIREVGMRADGGRRYVAFEPPSRETVH